MTNIQVDVCRTQYHKHAYEHVMKVGPYEYESILTCSGDGIVHEVINGIMHRDDKDIFVANTVLGIIPGGTANGFAKSICRASGEKCNPENCAFIIARGNVKEVDLMEIELASSSYKHYSFLAIAWGIIADIDLETDW